MTNNPQSSADCGLLHFRMRIVTCCLEWPLACWLRSGCCGRGMSVRSNNAPADQLVARIERLRTVRHLATVLVWTHLGFPILWLDSAAVGLRFR